ncbi:MAG: biotin/lipoate A/B protein ligase family protein [Planctomyces sp.]
MELSKTTLNEELGTGEACELIIDSFPRRGEENMRIDEALLNYAVEHRRNVLRIYRWSEPTVTTGYFQQSGPSSPALTALPTVQRLTGGGAILHDQEVTYSCVVSADHPLHRNPVQIYAIMHRAIIQLLGECGVQSRMRGDPISSADSSEKIQGAAEPFLCFFREDPHDIVVDRSIADRSVIDGEIHPAAPCKIVGSAQRRRKGAILQHGSILLAASRHAPEIPGIRDLCSGFRETEFLQNLPQQLIQYLGEARTFQGNPPPS